MVKLIHFVGLVHIFLGPTNGFSFLASLKIIINKVRNKSFDNLIQLSTSTQQSQDLLL